MVASFVSAICQTERNKKTIKLTTIFPITISKVFPTTKTEHVCVFITSDSITRRLMGLWGAAEVYKKELAA